MLNYCTAVCHADAACPPEDIQLLNHSPSLRARPHQNLNWSNVMAGEAILMYASFKPWRTASPAAIDL